MSRNVVGRGLGALLDSAAPSAEAVGVRELPLDLLHANPSQPRVDFDEEALDGLADSIRANGIIQPLVVRPMGEAYQVVTGERRLRAARRAGVTSVPVVVRHDLGEQDVLFLGLIENLQREDLNPVEEARSLEQLVATSGLTHDQVAKRIGRSRVHVTNTLRLLKLPDELLGWLRAGRLSAGHARALLGLDLPEQMLMLAERVMEEGWSVRKLEAYVKEYSRRRDQDGDPPRQRPLPKLFKKAATGLEELLGTKVAIRQVPGKKGRITIEFEHKKDLKRILERFQDLGVDDDGDED